VLQIEPLHPLFADEVTGVDLRRPLPEAEMAAVRDAFERLSVLAFPGQDLDDDAQIAFSRLLSPIEATRASAAGAGSPVIVLSNVGPDGAYRRPTTSRC
jgi:alpha-ketoglutarate-dependent taurine dioxygenase